MLRSAKLATPAALVEWLRVPESVPLAGLVPMETVTKAPETRFANASFTATSTAGVMCTPAVVVDGCTVNAAVAGAAAVMSNAVLSAVTGEGVLGTTACSMYPVPALLMLRSANAAIPAALVDRVSVPDRTPLAGFVPIDTVTEAPGTRLAKASLTVTSTAGVMWTPAVVVVGCTVNAAVAGAAAVMSNAVLFAVTADGVLGTVPCSVYPVPALSMLRSAKLATPLAFVDRVAVPASVPPPALIPIESVTDAPGTRLVKASVTVTSTAGAMWTPAVVELGCTENTAVAGAPGWTVTAAEVPMMYAFA